MTQKNSSFNFRTLVGNCCRRQSALFTLSALAMIAALPVYMILAIQSQLRFSDLNNHEVRASLVLNIRDILMAGSPVTLALVALAVIAGIAMFRYLHVRNQTDFFHSLPITRGQLFASHTLSGILAVVPAYLIGTALACAVCVAYGFPDAIDAKLLAYSVFAHLAGFLMVYAVTILAAIVSGHTLVSLLVCGWFQFGAFAGWAVINQLFYVLYPARAYSASTNPYWLSPPIQMFQMVETLGTGYYNNEEIRLPLHPFRDAVFIPALAYLVATAVILALCWLLNQKRKSEHTGLSIAFPIIEQPFKLYMVTVMGIACGLVFQATTVNWGIMFLGIALGALVTSCIVEIIYNLDFHSLFNRWHSLLVYAVVCAVVLGCMAMDVTHWNSALPDRDQIVSAELRSNVESWDCSAYGQENNGYIEGGGITWWSMMNTVARAVGGWDISGDEASEEAVGPMTSDVAIDAMYDSASIGAEAMKSDRSSITTGRNYENRGYQVVFTLKNGKTFTRQYYMPDGTEQLEENGAAVRFSQEYLETRTAAARAADESFDPVVLITKNYANAEQSACDTIKQKQGVISILKKLKTESMQLTQEYVSKNVPVLVIRAVNTYSGWSWNDLTNLNSGYYSDGTLRVIDIPVYACETDTLKILKQYAPELETGYASAEADHVTVEYWTEDEEFVSQTYDDAETIAECMKNSYPYAIGQTMDPVFTDKTIVASVSLTLADGTELSGYYYGDDDRLKKAAETEEEVSDTSAPTVGVIGGADGPTAVMISATANQRLGFAVGCLVGLIVVIFLARWLLKRRRKK
ncbi:MAG: hypothetical protein Q4P20_05090 [Eubacteriales bacterium]|nr:hypothetical protein [Eubacteriales bacterium]